MSSFVADQGRLPIQIPCSERLTAGSEAAAKADAFPPSAADGFPLTGRDFAVAVSFLTPVGGTVFTFLALRRAFLDEGSGALMLTSSSATSGFRFRFLDGVAEIEESDMFYLVISYAVCG